MRIIAIANHKGGVGKTITTINLGAMLAKDIYKVLLIDLDPQSSLTAALGVGDCAGRSMAEVIGSDKPGQLTIDKIILPIDENLYLAPSDLTLANCELGLTARLGRENVLKRALANIKNEYDLCLIDCPPSLSILTVNALAACQAIIAPVLPQAADLRGLNLFLQSLESLGELNPDAKLLGVLICQYDGRYLHHQEARTALERSGLPIFETIIGKSVRAAESMGIGKPLVNYDPTNPRSIEYGKLYLEVSKWLENQH